MKVTTVRTKSPSGKIRTYSSVQAASRVLSGNGTTSKAATIRRRVVQGGGFIGAMYIYGIAAA